MMRNRESGIHNTLPSDDQVTRARVNSSFRVDWETLRLANSTTFKRRHVFFEDLLSESLVPLTLYGKQ